LGREIMLHVIDYARVRGVRELRLDAQTHATGFYESLGFEYADRPEFMDAGIAHREMFLHLK
jgi:predicted GNAT family N-acyltransferase